MTMWEEIVGIIYLADPNEPNSTARQVLEAMREPSDEMLAPGYEAMRDKQTATHTWQAMIDAILKEKPTA